MGFGNGPELNTCKQGWLLQEWCISVHIVSAPDYLTPFWFLLRALGPQIPGTSP